MTDLSVDGDSFSAAAQRLTDLSDSLTSFVVVLGAEPLGGDEECATAWRQARTELGEMFARDGAGVRAAAEVFAEVDHALARGAGGR